MVDEKTFAHRAEVPERPRLVLADDDPVVVAMLGAQLRHAFDCVGVAGDAPSAIARVVEHKPDVVLLDVDMPRGGAKRATREIRSGSPETAIVILSSQETAREVVELINDGAVAHLRKGVDSATLTTKLRVSISVHRQLDSGAGVKSTG
jgi:DNA-binding NarL/FixJ family response regulator